MIAPKSCSYSDCIYLHHAKTWALKAQYSSIARADEADHCTSAFLECYIIMCAPENIDIKTA